MYLIENHKLAHLSVANVAGVDTLLVLLLTLKLLLRDGQLVHVFGPLRPRDHLKKINHKLD